ncbi:MAG: restriction endonuclease [Bacteroidota bacterium]
MNNHLERASRKVQAIKDADLSIYDSIDFGDKKYWLTSLELQAILDSKLSGIDLNGLPLRTRSKRVKSEICTALGYPIPKSFKKTKPRFAGQKFDIYTQKSNNLQIWNEDLDASRRYVIIRISDSDIITKAKVVSGSDLAPLDTTGTLTQKYQARLKNIENKYELVSETDTEYLVNLCRERGINLTNINPSDDPIRGKILPIKTIYESLRKVVGEKFVDPGSDQERNRGAELHRLVCKALGFSVYSDNGKFPDVRNQLLEVKLQTSPTIDLGLVSPDSESPLDMEKISSTTIRHCDIRYSIFYGKIVNGYVEISNLIVVKGKDFYERLPRFEGKGLNKKIQIRLPKDYFEE